MAAEDFLLNVTPILFLGHTMLLQVLSIGFCVLNIFCDNTWRNGHDQVEVHGECQEHSDVIKKTVVPNKMWIMKI